ncbi:MAG TPA: hypothetical protein VHF91_06740, partial [Acidimicrobiales bacterium]|nr:hypothetical protein [Acidimicrobiales bacterium]
SAWSAATRIREAAMASTSNGSTSHAERDRLVAAGLARTTGLTWERAARAHVELWEALVR